MSVNELCKQLNQALNNYIRPATFPIAVKISEKQEKISFRYRSPQKYFGHRLAICQGITIARRYGWTLGFSQQDEACPLAQIIFGYVEEPNFIKNGRLSCPLNTADLGAAARLHASIVKMPNADTKAVFFAPLHKAEFIPDIVMVYGNPAQIYRLIASALYERGGHLKSRFTGHCSCSAEIVVPYIEDRYNIVLPDSGEKFFGFADDYEMVFSIPRSKIEDLTRGIEHLSASLEKLSSSFEKYIMTAGASFLNSYISIKWDKLMDIFNWNDF
jgi:uncharacterized protein (DUF169 family)